MSIEIMFRLVCSGQLCRRPFGDFPEGRTDHVFRQDFEKLRHAAHAQGWRRLRPTVSGNVQTGDFCPGCVADISGERIARKATKRPRADKASGRKEKGSSGVGSVGSFGAAG
jgi:hypothetical protein